MRTCAMINAATLVVAVALTPVTADPIGTAFTYQGQLKLDDRPVDATIDLCFTLYNAATGGSSFGGPICFDGQGGNPDPIPIENGQFTVKLDFGVEMLTSQVFWLEVRVRSPHDLTYTVPSETREPRQRITPAPYSNQTRGIHVDENGNVGASTLPASQPQPAGSTEVIRIENFWQQLRECVRTGSTCCFPHALPLASLTLRPGESQTLATDEFPLPDEILIKPSASRPGDGCGEEHTKNASVR